MASPPETATENDASKKQVSIADAVVPWFLLVLAALAAIGAVVRVVGDREARLTDRLNETTLLYLAVSGALVLLKRVKTLSFGSYKLEMLEQIRERQIKTEDLLRNVTTKLLPLLLPEPERKHLLNLASGATTQYKGGVPVQNELRRLLGASLLVKKKDKNNQDKHIRDLKPGVSFDLADYVELTPLGIEWLQSIRDIEAAPPAKPAAASEL
jgi:hypothetical protein